MSVLTLERLKDLLTYDPLTGNFIRLVTVGPAGVGSVAGGLNAGGYIKITIDGKKYSAGRLAWFYVKGEWPKDEVDHENRIRSDNRWDNIRGATKLQNASNKGALSNNTSGFTGVSRMRSKWRAGIRIEGRQKWLGTFDTPEEAAKAYAKAASEYYGNRFSS